MNNVALFAVTVLIWGTSWIAIAWQIGPVPISVSVFYRILLAAILLFLALTLLGRLSLPTRWWFVILQGLCLFSLNFVALYKATALIPSGLVSVIFSLASTFNALNARIFFGDRITSRVVIAGAIGVLGLVFLFWESLAVSLNFQTLQGAAWASLGTLIFSWGNMASRSNSTFGISPILANAWSMGIGACILLVLITVSGQRMVVPPDTTYVVALIYLAVFASVVGFTTYLLLVERIGSAQAAYATVLFPVVALLVSTLLESYQWTLTGIVGVGLALLGNVVMFAAPRSN